MSGNALTSEEIERYARHIVLAEVGGSGQQKLKASRVLVVGAGGLGSPVILYLAAAGAGTIGVVDDDMVSLSNLQRQVLHDTASTGEPKTESAKARAEAINPHVRVVPHPVRLTAQNAGDLLGDYDIIVDGSDNFTTRYLVADMAANQEKPLVTGALGRFDGSLTVLTPFRKMPDGTACPSYRDIFPTPPPDGTVPSCAEAGVLGAVAGVIGTLQALEVIKLITGAGEPLIGRLLLFDGMSMRFETVQYRAAKRQQDTITG